MAFKIVEKTAGVKGLNNNELSINSYGVGFGIEISNKFNGFTSCEVYLDRDNRKVGFKPTNNTLKGFRVGRNKQNNRASISGKWATQLPNKRFVTRYEDDMIIINDCDIADIKPKAHKE